MKDQTSCLFEMPLAHLISFISRPLPDTDGTFREITFYHLSVKQTTQSAKHGFPVPVLTLVKSLIRVQFVSRSETLGRIPVQNVGGFRMAFKPEVQPGKLISFKSLF